MSGPNGSGEEPKLSDGSPEAKALATLVLRSYLDFVRGRLRRYSLHDGMAEERAVDEDIHHPGCLPVVAHRQVMPIAVAELPKPYCR